MFKTEVVNKYKSDRYDVYIGRGSPYGNPYVIGIDGNREQVIRKYSEYFYKRLSEDVGFLKQVMSLKGKRLACFCHPKACHGDVIIGFLHKDEMDGVIDGNFFDYDCKHC